MREIIVRVRDENQQDAERQKRLISLLAIGLERLHKRQTAAPSTGSNAVDCVVTIPPTTDDVSGNAKREG